MARRSTPPGEIRDRRRPSAPDVLEVLARFEADGAARRDAHFLAGPGITADAALTGLNLEYAKATQLDSLTTLHREPHRLEHGVDRHLGLDLGDIGDARHLIHDVDLDHA